MENKERKDYYVRFHLDPRTKLILLILFSVVVMIDISNGPAYIVRTVMTYIPVILICLEGKPHVGARFTILFILTVWLTDVIQENVGGIAGMLILFLCYMVTQFAPTMIMVWYCISTTKINEFMAAMNRMCLPQGLTISIAVMMRFFPTLAEEYRSIRDAMRMRGIGFGGGKLLKMVEYRLVPLLFSCISIGDELSAAAVTRGLGAPVKRTNVCEIGFHVKDFAVLAVTIALVALYVYFSNAGGSRMI